MHPYVGEGIAGPASHPQLPLCGRLRSPDSAAKTVVGRLPRYLDMALGQEAAGVGLAASEPVGVESPSNRTLWSIAAMVGRVRGAIGVAKQAVMTQPSPEDRGI
jgi:hypothetical protein